MDRTALKSETGVDMGISNNKIIIKFSIGKNIQLVDEEYKILRKENKAKFVEWMIKGEEALKDFLFRIGLRYNNLGRILRNKLKKDLKDIKNKAKSLSKVDKKVGMVVLKDKLLKNRNIEITIKCVKGKWRKVYPAVNIVIPILECIKRKMKYRLKLTFEEAIKVGYKVLYYISISEMSESKGLKTATSILGKGY